MAMRDEIVNLISNNIDVELICKPIPLPSKKIARIISAFSNTEGGFIVFGAVQNSQKINIVGLSNDFHLISIFNKAVELLKPRPHIEHELISIKSKNIFVIKVLKSKKTIFYENSMYIIEKHDITKCIGEIILDKTKVFIVHGHDNLAKQETARFVESLGLKAIILHEQASAGSTIIEKIEAYSNVGFAIVLYTPCDLGKAKDEDEFNSRARQNVVFEHGYLMGKIGRKNVCALVKSQVEKPNDISGVVYIDMDDNGAWKIAIIKEMKSAGYEIDANKLYI
jgi:predicted nucleotide-binding protein